MALVVHLARETGFAVASGTEREQLISLFKPDSRLDTARITSRLNSIIDTIMLMNRHCFAIKTRTNKFQHTL